MANTEPTIPTSGTEAPSKFLMGLDENDDTAKFDEALRQAFGDKIDAGPDTPDTTNTDTDTDDTDTDTDDTDGAEDTGDEGAEGSGGAEGGGESAPGGASASGEGEGGEGQSSEPSGVTDFASLFRERYGVEPTAEDIQGYIQLAEWAAGLTPEQQAAINSALTNPAAYTQQPGTQSTQTPPGSPQSSQPYPQSTDPIYAELIEEYGEDHPLIKYISVQQQNAQQFAQFTAEQRYQQNVAKIESGTKAFQARYNLDENEVRQLQGAVAQAGTFPAFTQAFGDPEVAIQNAMEYTYWSDPRFRQREIQRQMDEAKVQQQQADTRKRKASSVTGTGGNGASRTAPPPKTVNDRWAAVAAGIAEAQSNGQQP